MAEPLSEETEVSWIEFMNKFNEHIYPTCFEPYGISRDAALMAWTFNMYSNSLDTLLRNVFGDEEEGDAPSF